MQAYFKLSNDILDSGLTPNELKVAVYLYSCLHKGNSYVSVKQRVIASKCGISKVETVGNIICRLQRKGVIERVSRPHKTNGQLGTYIYKLKKIASIGFFKVKRYILGKLTGVQLRMYLFICRAITKKNMMWNSFNDISHSLRIARSKVIAVINELVGLGFIRRLRVLKKDGSYSDNHYSVTEPEIQKKDVHKKASPKQGANLFGTQRKRIKKLSYQKYNPIIVCCQAQNQSWSDFLSGVVP